MSFAIEVDGLSKLYRLGATHSKSLREVANRTAGRIARGFTRRAAAATVGDPVAKTPTEFWALKDISFSVPAGEVVGVIGRNGAGKSTLLKILSRITRPTAGRAVLRGRVASLLEVGTGFHPELSGRENVFLNGTLLGMTKQEVARKFDEIVDFAGVEKFIDTPTKRYSSGMTVRLGFAVAAHLDPEILIVDEVLAVGDVDFQRKCLGKMNQVARDGRTILFVSHNMAAAAQLCQRGVVLEEGRVKGVYPIREAISEYVASNEARTPGFRAAGDTSLKPASIVSVMTRQDGAPATAIRHDRPFSIALELQLAASMTQTCRLSIAVCDSYERKIFTSYTEIPVSSGNGDRTCDAEVAVRGRFLMPGRYSLIVGVLDAGLRILDRHRFVAPFVIEDAGDEMNLRADGEYGVVFADFPWTVTARA